MVHSDSLMRCFVLMLFRGKYERIYETVIVPLFSRLSDEHGVAWGVGQANSPADYELERTKVEGIYEHLN
jgi:hypothetical protein